MKYKNKDVDFSEALVQKRLAPKNKNWYSIIEDGTLVTKPRKVVTKAEKRARKNKSSFWNSQKAAV